MQPVSEAASSTEIILYKGFILKEIVLSTKNTKGTKIFNEMPSYELSPKG